MDGLEEFVASRVPFNEFLTRTYLGRVGSSC